MPSTGSGEVVKDDVACDRIRSGAALLNPRTRSETAAFRESLWRRCHVVA